MRILMATSSFPRYPGDWAGVFLLSLARELVRRGHRVTVLCPHGEGLPTEDEMDGIRIVRFRYGWPDRLQKLAYGRGMLTNVRENPARLLLVPLYLVALGFSLRALARKHDVVNVHFMIPQGLAARIFRVRAIVTLHGSDVNLGWGGMGRRLIGFGLKRASAVTANSKATADKAACAVPADRIRIIPMGVDGAAFSGRKGRERGFSEEGFLNIISVGRLIPLKGQRYLIGALAAIRERLPGAILTLVGDGPERPILIRYAEDLGMGDAVRFLGELPHDRIPAVLAAHDVFVLPSVVMSTGETEGLGTVLLEAMAAGLPVVGSAVGGIPDIIRNDETGLLVPERSPGAIAEAVLRIASDADLRERLAAGGKREVEERFSWGTIARQFERLFLEVSSHT